MERQARGELTTADLASATESTEEERRGDTDPSTAPRSSAERAHEATGTDPSGDDVGDGQQQADAAGAEAPSGPLFPSEELSQLRGRWEIRRRRSSTSRVSRWNRQTRWWPRS
jgi:hypothetical protein